MIFQSELQLLSSLYGHPGYPPIPGSRRAEGLDPLEMAVEEIISSQERLSTVDRIPPWRQINGLWSVDH